MDGSIWMIVLNGINIVIGGVEIDYVGIGIVLMLYGVDIVLIMIVIIWCWVDFDIFYVYNFYLEVVWLSGIDDWFIDLFR